MAKIGDELSGFLLLYNIHALKSVFLLAAKVKIILCNPASNGILKQQISRGAADVKTVAKENQVCGVYGW